MAIKRIILLFIILLFSTNLKSQLSKIHYIPPMVEGSDKVAEQWMYISTPNIGEIPVYIKPIGQPRANWIIVNVSNSKPHKEPISGSPNSQLIVRDSSIGLNATNDKGYIVESPDGLIYVNVRFNSSSTYQQGGFVSKGEAALGSVFRTAVMPNGNATTGRGDGFQNFISILSTDDTKIRIDNIPNGLSSIDNSGITFPFEIELKKNESFVLSQSFPDTSADSSPSNTERFALIGALIQEIDSSGNPVENKNLVVNTGSITGHFSTGGGRDYGIDQITGLSTLGDGNQYILVKGNGGGNNVENALIIAHEPNTKIWINNSEYQTLNNAGDFLYYEIPGDPGENVFISTNDNSKPIFVYQSTGFNYGLSGANQGMFFVPPISCSSKGNIDLIPFVGEPVLSSSGQLFEGQLSIVTNSGAELFVKDSDGNILADKTGTAPLNLNSLMNLTVQINGGQYETYYLNSNLFKGRNIKIESDKELYVAYISQNGPATSGSFFSGFVTIPQIIPELELDPLGVCISASGNSNVLLETANSSGFDKFQWKIKNKINGNWEDAPIDANDPNHKNDESSYKPIIEGTYKLVANLNCFSEDYESPEQIVFICPDDLDDDGIIDNLDLDSDNDGILNSIESIPNIAIDLSNINSPSANWGNGNTVFENVQYTPTASGGSSFTGSSTGQFKSINTAIGVNESSKYSIEKIESGTKFNIHVSEDQSSSAHTVNGVSELNEKFVLTVFPSDKSITVYDPGERLLVDDGSGFKPTGLNGYSGNSIIFRYNSDPLDNSQNIDFYAKEIDGFEFEHFILSGASSDSEFNGFVEIIEFEIDTDGDGIPDSLDIDSDGDSCFSNDWNDDFSESNTFFDNTSSDFSGLFDLNGDGSEYALVQPLNKNLTFPDDIDVRGRIISLLDATTNEYIEPPTHPDPANNNYLFQIQKNTINLIQPIEESVQVCQEGESAQFSIALDPGGNTITPYYQWQYNDGSGWVNLEEDNVKYPNSVQDATLQIADVKTEMNNFKFRVIFWTNANLCPVISGEGELKVEATLPTVKNIDYDDAAFSHVVVCDDGSDLYDGVSNFDLTNGGDLTDYFLDNRTDVVVDYFIDSLLVLDPNATSDISDYTSFENIPDSSYDPNQPTAQTFEIHVRIKNTISNCIAPPQSFELTVNPLPIIKKEVHIDEKCKQTKINLTANNEFFSDNYANEIFSFYKIDEISGNEIEINNPENYTTNGTPDNPELIRVRFKTKDEGCFQPSVNKDNGDVENFVSLYVYSAGSDIPENFHEDWVNDNISSLTKLESTNDPKGQTQTAVETFDSSVFTNIIDELKEIPEFQESGLVFYFYRSQNHMDNFQGSSDPNIIYSSKDPVASYTIDPQDEDSANDNEDGFRFNEAKQRWEQDIFLYVRNENLVQQDNITNCVGEEKVATLFVERKPIAYDVDVLQECDDFESGTEFDGIAGFDTTSIINTLITNPTTGVVDQDPGRFDIIFSYDKEGNDPITDFSSINFESTTQTIYVTMVNKFTETLDGSGNPTYGQSSTEIEFEVYKNPAYGQDIVEESGKYLYKQFVAFEGNDETDESLFNDGEAFFDLTGIEEKLIDQNQDVADFTFTFNPTPSDFTKYTATDTSEIEVTIYNNTYDTDPSVPYCEKKVIIDFTVLQRPDFDVDDSTPTIYVCLIQDENNYTDVDTKDDYPLVPQSLEGKIGVIGTPTNDYPNNLEYTYSWEFQGETPTGGTAPPTQVLPDTDPRIELDPTKDPEQLKGRYFVTLTATYKSPDLNGTALAQTKTIKYIDVDVSQAPKMTLDLKQTIVTIDDLNYQNRTNITIDDSNIESLIGIGDYEYQLEKNRTINGVQVIDIVEPFSYQTEFRDKEPGIYSLRLRDKNGCNPEVTIPLYALGYMKYFTPNGDGVNDKWNIIGIDTGSPIEAPLYIFDRFGKLIREINPAGTGVSGFVEEGWDGTFNGKPMPQADYWFKVIVTEPGDEPKVFNGHFTLIRGQRRSIN